MNLIYQSLSLIPNRYAFLDRIDQAIKQDSKLSLLLIDVVRFSDVSSSLGYRAGDFILSEIAQRIQLLLAEMTMIGRVSGDIFGVVIPGQHSKTQLQGFYNHLVEHFKTPIAYQDHSFIADFNVGAVANNNSNRNIHELFSRAEAALKQAKQNKYENFFALKVHEKVQSSRQLTLKADLKRAFEQHELELYFQPKVNLRDLEIIGAECLLRWHHPLDGLIFPGPLLEAAESYNMMNEMGYWVLENAMRSQVELQARGLDIPLSVNMSPTQLYDIKFVGSLRKLLEKYQLSPQSLELELTEDIALSNSLMVHRQLTQLRDMGFRVAIDDFGKGYSNLAYMRDMQIDTVKIDKTFVMQLDDNPVNKAIIKATQIIAESLHCDVVAEGIETLSHLHVLRELGIEVGQGFLFSKAVPLSEFVRLSQQEITVGSSLSYRRRNISNL